MAWIDAFVAWLGAQKPEVASFFGNVAGSFLGLLAILIGALFNAYLNRRRDDRLRLEEKRGVATALVAELSAKSVSLRENVKTIDKFGKDDTGFSPDISQHIEIWNELAGKITHFNKETIIAIIGAYTMIGEYGERLSILDARIYEKAPPGRRIFVLPQGSEQPNALKSIKIVMERTAVIIDHAIELLEVEKS